MSETIELQAQVRSAIGGGIKALRRNGKTPAIIYGHQVSPLAVQLDTRTVTNTLRKVGKNTLIRLNVDGESEPRTVLIREVQRDPIRRALLHLDFQQISMTEHIRATVRVVTIGEPEAVRSGVGVLDVSNYAKYIVEGPGAGGWLDRCVANKVPTEIGRRMANRIGAEFNTVPADHFWPYEAPDEAVAILERLWQRAESRPHTILTQPPFGG